MTEAEDFLKVDGWYSEYKSVDVPLQYLKKSKSGSASTRNSFLNILKNFCKHNRVLPDEIIKQSKKKIEQEVESYLSSLKKRKRSEDERVGSTRNTYWTILQIFFRENNRSDIVIKREHQSSRPKLNVIKLNLEDAWKIIDYASPKIAALLAIVLVTGLRASTVITLRYNVVETIEKYFRKYTIKNELEKDEKNPVIIIYKKMKEVNENSVKYGIPYITYLHPSATDCLVKWLKILYDKNHGLEDNMVIFNTENRSVKQHKRKFIPITTEGVNVEIKKFATIAGVENASELCSKDFRTLFQTTIDRGINAEAVSERIRSLFKGHTLGKPQESYLTWDVEQLREEYKKLKFLPEEFIGDGQYWKPVAEFHDVPYDKIVEITKLHYSTKNPTSEQIKCILFEYITKNKERIIVPEDTPREKILKMLNDGWRREFDIKDAMVMSRQRFGVEIIKSKTENINSNKKENQIDIAELENKYQEELEKRKKRKNRKGKQNKL